ncbi:hypothetical protein CRM22_010803 [Opisthorchis felineus]|uniref:Uncharacterized protein n=1 Tax=Opisthorchis felineus TaxID=147828 RepID=A0A4S2KR65_OPIFE|nr:hypothetical protein CRM22_010803 [Opisthorchis felineus]
MVGTQVAPCTIVDATLSKPLLLRSISTPKSVLCSCGSLPHGQLSVEVVPSRLFTRSPDKLSSFVRHLVDGFEHVRMKNTSWFTNEMFLLQKNNGAWCNILFTNEQLSPFAHTWSALIRMNELFNSHSEMCSMVKLCNVTGGLCGKSSCPCTGLQVRTSGVAPVGTDHLYLWAPCSRTFAIELTMSWAKLTMDADEQSEPMSGVTNLSQPSFGVLENWVDLLLLGQLSALATNSVQVEPEPASFLEESTCPLSPDSDSTAAQQVEAVVLKNDQLNDADPVSAVTRRNTLTIILHDSSEDDIACNDLGTNSKNWSKLAQSWDLTIEKRKCEPGTIVIDMFNPALDTLVEQVLQFRQTVCTRF